MKIISVSWKNFNSYGNIEQVLNFDTNEGNLYLLHAPSGSGKCLHPDTRIDIEIKNSIIRNKFLNLINFKPLKHNELIKCTLGDLLRFENITTLVSSGCVRVLTRKGLKNINAVSITAKDSSQIKISTNNKFIIGSPDHLLFHKDWKRIKDFKIGDFIETSNGLDVVTNIELLDDKIDLLDIQVDDIKEFFANDFVSHNSTIAEVIVYSLYGKVEKKNKADLPNRINKGLECSIKLISKNRLVEIERGIAPSFLRVKVDGNEYDTAGVSNIQDYLDKEIFDIPYHVFKNIVVLSINDFRSFLTMTPNDKRNIIDKLFGFSVINDMKDSIKNERKDIKDKLKTIHDELFIIESTIKSVEDRIDLLEKSEEVDRNKTISDFKEKITDLLKNKKNIDIEYKKLQDLENKFIFTIEDKKQHFSNISHEIKTTKDKIKLYENDVCPSCGSPLTTDNHIHTKVLLEQIVDKNENVIVDIKNDIIELNKKLKVVSEKTKDCYNKSTKTSFLINQHKEYIGKIIKNDKENSKLSLLDLLDENKEKINKRKLNQNEFNSEDSFLEILEYVLGDDGVKNLAMKTILPTLNQNINNMINQVHLPYMIRFDDKFDCIITSLGEQINPLSMSTGERKRADFIIIIALLKILKIQYPSLNILFLDEIFSSVDASGVYEIIKILQDVTKENKLNTWVINHSELPMELFDKRVEIIKQGGFSQLLKESIQ